MESKNRYISFVTTPALQATLRKAAKEQERSLSWLIGKALEEYLVKLGYLKKGKPSGR